MSTSRTHIVKLTVRQQEKLAFKLSTAVYRRSSKYDNQINNYKYLQISSNYRIMKQTVVILTQISLSTVRGMLGMNWVKKQEEFKDLVALAHGSEEHQLLQVVRQDMV